MKKLLCLFVLILWGTHISAQGKYELFEFYEGYIITETGEKQRGYIRYLDESDRYEKVVFKKEHKGKKQRFKAKDIAGYKVADVVYHAIQYEDIPFKSNRFLVLEKEGCLNLYSYRKLNNGAWEAEKILKNKDRAVTTQKFVLGFAKKMAEMVADDKELASKIRNKEKGYSLLNMEAIIDEYNSRCNP